MSEVRYRLEIQYAAGNVQVHEDLPAEAAEAGAGAFLRDLFGLEGKGTRRVQVSVAGDDLSTMLEGGQP